MISKLLPVQIYEIWKHFEMNVNYASSSLKVKKTCIYIYEICMSGCVWIYICISLYI